MTSQQPSALSDDHLLSDEFFARDFPDEDLAVRITAPNSNYENLRQRPVAPSSSSAAAAAAATAAPAPPPPPPSQTNQIVSSHIAGKADPAQASAKLTSRVQNEVSSTVTSSVDIKKRGANASAPPPTNLAIAKPAVVLAAANGDSLGDNSAKAVPSLSRERDGHAFAPSDGASKTSSDKSIGGHKSNGPSVATIYSLPAHTRPDLMGRLVAATAFAQLSGEASHAEKSTTSVKDRAPESTPTLPSAPASKSGFVQRNMPAAVPPPNAPAISSAKPPAKPAAVAAKPVSSASEQRAEAAPTTPQVAREEPKKTAEQPKPPAVVPLPDPVVVVAAAIAPATSAPELSKPFDASNAVAPPVVQVKPVVLEEAQRDTPSGPAESVRSVEIEKKKNKPKAKPAAKKQKKADQAEEARVAEPQKSSSVITITIDEAAPAPAPTPTSAPAPAPAPVSVAASERPVPSTPAPASLAPVVPHKVLDVCDSESDKKIKKEKKEKKDKKRDKKGKKKDKKRDKKEKKNKKHAPAETDAAAASAAAATAAAAAAEKESQDRKKREEEVDNKVKDLVATVLGRSIKLFESASSDLKAAHKRKKRRAAQDKYTSAVDSLLTAYGQCIRVGSSAKQHADALLRQNGLYDALMKDKEAIEKGKPLFEPEEKKEKKKDKKDKKHKHKDAKKKSEDVKKSGNKRARDEEDDDGDRRQHNEMFDMSAEESDARDSAEEAEEGEEEEREVASSEPESDQAENLQGQDAAGSDEEEEEEGGAPRDSDLDRDDPELVVGDDHISFEDDDLQEEEPYEPHRGFSSRRRSHHRHGEGHRHGSSGSKKNSVRVIVTSDDESASSADRRRSRHHRREESATTKKSAASAAKNKRPIDLVSDDSDAGGKKHKRTKDASAPLPPGSEPEIADLLSSALSSIPQMPRRGQAGAAPASISVPLPDHPVLLDSTPMSSEKVTFAMPKICRAAVAYRLALHSKLSLDEARRCPLVDDARKCIEACEQGRCESRLLSDASLFRTYLGRERTYDTSDKSPCTLSNCATRVLDMMSSDALAMIPRRVFELAVAPVSDHAIQLVIVDKERFESLRKRLEQKQAIDPSEAMVATKLVYKNLLSDSVVEELLVDELHVGLLLIIETVLFCYDPTLFIREFVLQYARDKENSRLLKESNKFEKDFIQTPERLSSIAYDVNTVYGNEFLNFRSRLTVSLEKIKQIQQQMAQKMKQQ